MAKKESTLQGIDPAILLELLQTFGAVAPQVVALLQTLADAWKRKHSGLQASPKCAASEATTHCCSCCDEALNSAMETVARLLDCKDCCTP